MNLSDALLPEHRGPVRLLGRSWSAAFGALALVCIVNALSMSYAPLTLVGEAGLLGLLALLLLQGLVEAAGGTGFLNDKETAPFVDDRTRRRAGVTLVVYYAGAAAAAAGLLAGYALEFSGGRPDWLVEAVLALGGTGLVFALGGGLAFWWQRWRVRHAALLA